MAGSAAPFPWNPSTNKTPLIGGQVTAGEWVQVFVSYRNTNGNPVVYTPGRFMIHVIVTPCSDELGQYEQPTTLGGSMTAENRRREYHVDPGVCFQVPWRSELSVIAGGNSLPDVMVDIIVARGFPPRMTIEQVMAQYGEYEANALIAQGRPPLLFPPPVVGLPQLVPATWIDIPINTPLPFPDGALKMEAVNQSGVPASPIQLSVTAFSVTQRIDLASGALRSIGPWSQGGQCSNGIAGTWQSAVALGSMTIYSSFGN